MSEKPTYEELEHLAEELRKAGNERTSLDKQLQFQSLAIEHSSEGIAMVDLDGNIEYSNNAFAEMHGYYAKEIVGKNLSIFHTPEQMPHVEAANLEVKQTGRFKGKIWHVRRDRTVFPTLMSNSIILDKAGKPIGMMGTLRDVADLKHAEDMLQKAHDALELRVEKRTADLSKANEKLKQEIEARIKIEKSLQKKEERYAQLFNSGNDAVFVHGIGNGGPGKFTEVNDVACMRLGYRREELLRMSPVDIDAGGMDEARRRALEMLAETGQCVFEMVHASKSGDKIPVEISSRIFESEGKPHVLSIARDITERKRAEEELKNKAQNLEDLNTALNVLLKNRENDKTDLEDRFLDNIKQLVLPYLDKIENRNRDANQEALIDILRKNLSEVTSSFSHNLSSKYFSLTPAEIQVANFIKQGKNTKKIAGILNISAKTVKNYRQKIRAKIGIANKKINLQSYLSSLN